MGWEYVTLTMHLKAVVPSKINILILKRAECTKLFKTTNLTYYEQMCGRSIGKTQLINEVMKLIKRLRVGGLLNYGRGLRFRNR